METHVMAAAEFLAPAGIGIEVPLGRVDSELKKLWKQGEGVVTRASLINLVIYSEVEGSLPINSTMAAEITQDHACRVLLVEAGRRDLSAEVEAWITAHCHVSRAGGRQVCCEQVAFRVAGPLDALTANTILAHLDSDLPLVLWWQPALPTEPHRELWSRVDRLIFDSATWINAGVEAGKLRSLQQISTHAMILSDLNWNRSLPLRTAMAQLHDQPGVACGLPSLTNIIIHHGTEGKTGAQLLAAWFARQMKWKMKIVGTTTALFAPDSNIRCEVEYIAEGDGPHVIAIEGRGDYQFQVRFAPESGLVMGSTTLADGHVYKVTAPGVKMDPAQLMGAELERGSEHRIYPEVLAMLAASQN